MLFVMHFNEETKAIEISGNMPLDAAQQLIFHAAVQQAKGGANGNP